MYAIGRTNITLNYCVFSRNFAGQRGGALYVDLGARKSTTGLSSASTPRLQSPPTGIPGYRDRKVAQLSVYRATTPPRTGLPGYRNTGQPSRQ